MTHTIISKRPTPFHYQQYDLVNGNFIPKGKGVIINGGAGIVGGRDLMSAIPLEKRSSLIPESVLTFVDDDILDYLLHCDKFNSDVSRGLVEVVNGFISETEGDKIAKSDMLDNEHIKDRPFTQKDIEEAGGEINDDGSVNINKAVEDIGASREANAGAPTYVKKRNLEANKAKRGRKSK